MVASIPPPALSSLLPAFLAHIPASFASPKPPPSLPPLLTPLTRSRLTHLSFNISPSTTATTSWLSLLTWSSNPSDGQTLQGHLASQDYYFLHQPPSPGTFITKGYRRLDSETLQCLVEVPELEIVVLYQFVAGDVVSEDGVVGDAWKVQDVRLADDEDVLLVGGRFWEGGVEVAEEEFRAWANRYNTYSYGNTSQQLQKSQTLQGEEEEDSDDDYWGRYDDEETESCAGDQDPITHQQVPPPRSSQNQQIQSHVQIAASMLARRVLQAQTEEEKEEEEYYARYANVEPVLDNPPPPPAAVAAAAPTGEGDRRDSISTNITSTSTTFDAQTVATPLTAFTDPSTKVSPVMAATTILNNKNNNNNTASHHPKPEVMGKKVVAGLESAAEVHTQSEVAIQQHVSTSVKSLYRLWKAGGMDMEEFGRFLEREVEVLKVVEEAGELGS